MSLKIIFSNTVFKNYYNSNNCVITRYLEVQYLNETRFLKQLQLDINVLFYKKKPAFIPM